MLKNSSLKEIFKKGGDVAESLQNSPISIVHHSFGRFLDHFSIDVEAEGIVLSYQFHIFLLYFGEAWL